MQTSVGVFLFVVGMLAAVAGLVFGLLALDAPGGGGIVVLMVFVGIAAVTLIIVGLVLMRRAKAARTNPVVDGRIGDYLIDTPEMRQLDGNAFEVLYQKQVPGKNGRPSSLRIRVAVASPTTLQFTKETGFDRFCKGIGIAREYQTEDAAFDDAVYIRGPSFGFAEKYLADSEKRDSILHLTALGFQTVRLTGADVEAVWTKFNPAADDAPELMEYAVRDLFTLADQVPVDDPDFASDRMNWGRVWTIFLWIFAVAWAATLTFVFVYVPIRTSDVVAPTLTLFAIAYPLFVLSAGFLLHGTSTSHDRWGPLIGVGLFLFGAGSVGVVAGVNALGDNSPAVERRLIVSDKHVYHGSKGSRTYYATVADWDRRGENIDFKVSLVDYNAISPRRSHLLLTTAQGRLGIEWLRELRVN